MAKTMISSVDLSWIFVERLKAFKDCPTSVSVAIVPDAKSGWSAITNERSRYPLCTGRVKEIQNELRRVYRLAGD